MRTFFTSRVSLQVLNGNGTMRPFILVGIENTDRRRDLTGPTDNPEDRKMAPRAGGADTFRAFIRAELMPAVRFQNDPHCGVFLISLKAGGLGLNLSAADYVFILDPWWNPAVETQAIDRAHRVGQTRRVFAYRLICKGTVEEKIDALIESKQQLSRDLLEGGVEDQSDRAGRRCAASARRARPRCCDERMTGTRLRSSKEIVPWNAGGGEACTTVGDDATCPWAHAGRPPRARCRSS